MKVKIISEAFYLDAQREANEFLKDKANSSIFAVNYAVNNNHSEIMIAYTDEGEN